jgi:putative acetyltransferase
MAEDAENDDIAEDRASFPTIRRRRLLGLPEWWIVTELTIRAETAADSDAITAVTEAAFRDSGLPGDRTEHYIIPALRDAGALTVSLVAEQDGAIVGHIAFSPATISDGTTGWYTLGPVSVLPEQQRRGVGTALIRAGLDRLKTLGAQGCVLIGHPDYYPRFGFVHPEGLSYADIPPEIFFALAFDGHYPAGQVSDHPAFRTDGSPQ